jgi:proteasome lid subunit RPN8/RPN11
MNKIIQINNKSLVLALVQASEECSHTQEEEGGLILSKDEERLFIKIKNKHKGTVQAVGLYETDLTELKDKVFSKLSEGWKMYASFHTHPSFSPSPSSLDLNSLFVGFVYNFIYSPIGQIYSLNTWLGDTSYPYYVPKTTLLELLK